MAIEVTNYTKIDKPTNKGMEKKVIAQQVEHIYPQAVSNSTDVIPDIYQVAEIHDGVIRLSNDLQAGDRVKFIFEGAGSEILEVVKADKCTFEVSSEHRGSVFVYGREVNDFRSVDYEALSVLNISATQ